jgi:hypothetical protein
MRMRKVLWIDMRGTWISDASARVTASMFLPVSSGKVTVDLFGVPRVRQQGQTGSWPHHTSQASHSGNFEFEI